MSMVVILSSTRCTTFCWLIVKNECIPQSRLDRMIRFSSHEHEKKNKQDCILKTIWDIYYISFHNLYICITWNRRRFICAVNLSFYSLMAVACFCQLLPLTTLSTSITAALPPPPSPSSSITPPIPPPPKSPLACDCDMHENDCLLVNDDPLRLQTPQACWPLYLHHPSPLSMWVCTYYIYKQ